jgi:ABC-type glycerol-3-phosphate transport system substrate-binding protein
MDRDSDGQPFTLDTPTSRRAFLRGMGVVAAAGAAGAAAGGTFSSAAKAAASRAGSAFTATTTVRLWDSMPTPTQKFWLTHLYPKFTKLYPHVRIAERDYGTEKPSVISAGLAAGGSNAPNMAWLAHESIGEFAHAHRLADVEAWLHHNPKVKANILPSLLEVSAFKGVVSTLPWMTNCTSFLINTDAFNAAKVPIPSQNPEKTWTWDEFASACKALTTSSQKGYTMQTNNNVWDAWLFGAWIASAGGFFVSDTGQVGFDKAPGIKAATFLQDLVKSGSTISATANDGLTPWLAGKAAIMTNGPWNLPTLASFNTFKFTVVPFPRDVRPATNLGGDQLYIFNSGGPAVQAGAFDYAKYMLSDSFQVAFNIESGNLPVTKSASKNPAYQAQLRKYPFLAGWVNSIPYGVPLPKLPSITSVFTYFDTAWNNIMLNNASVQSELSRAATESKALLGTH